MIKMPRWGKTPGFGTTARNDGPVGTLMTLSLPPDSPVADLPWVITIGALGDEEDWEPVVCGPYERGHALALAQAVVADEELMAVVEPLLPLVDADGDPRRDRAGPGGRRVRAGAGTGGSAD